MNVHDHLPLDELQRLAKDITKKRVWLRSQAVILARQGGTADGIAHALGCSPRAVQTWVAKFNQGGPHALNERPHPGRPPGRSGSASRSGWRRGRSPRTASVRSTAATSSASSSTSSACS